MHKIYKEKNKFKSMVNAYKFGGGAGAILLGLYFLNKGTNNTPMAIAGIICIAVGIGIIASEK